MNNLTKDQIGLFNKALELAWLAAACITIDKTDSSPMYLVHPPPTCENWNEHDRLCGTVCQPAIWKDDIRYPYPNVSNPDHWEIIYRKVK